MHNWLEIDLEALKKNFLYIKKIATPADIMPVVKSDAYGHGMVEVAKTLYRLGAKNFAVSKFYEALILREAGISCPIIVLSGLEQEEFEEAYLKEIRPVIFTFKHLEHSLFAARKHQNPFPIHIKVDTGMGRLGLSVSEFKKLIAKIAHEKTIFLEGIMTHFADADNPNGEYTAEQCNTFHRVLDELKRLNIQPLYIHAANSAATFMVPQARFNMVRPGLALYGPTPFAKNLFQVMSFKARILQVKEVPPGITIGYGRTFKTPHSMKVATVSVGYADGYPRYLSNKGVVLIKGKRCNVIGRVSMNLITVDVTHLEDKVREGDEVVLLGKQGNECIYADEIAKEAGTISYEIYCRFGNNPSKTFHKASSIMQNNGNSLEDTRWL